MCDEPSANPIPVPLHHCEEEGEKIGSELKVF